ncbi:MAG: ImmA/IrrE family metallo-endopeptidase [Gallionella sp.]|nr:ImmA/IrrE family metallo-endopeptidase [Gallionella sp.]MDH2904563.1 XRE family transcriptional regulator [Actinomycetota bacterium]
MNDFSEMELNSEALVTARESRGFSQADVATAVGINQGLMSKAEHGLLNLKKEHVQEIAEFLNYPMELFYEPGRIRTTPSACLHYMKRKTLPAGILKKLTAQMELRVVSVRRLLSDLELNADREFCNLDPDEYDGPEEVAKILRRLWRLPRGPIPNMVTLLESAGAMVILSEFGTSKLMGMSCSAKDSSPLFFLNGEASVADRRWTMAHELGHLTMHNAFPPSGDIEKQADAFAAEFLAPSLEVGPTLRNLKFEDLGMHKSLWKISMKAIIKYASSMGAISQDHAVRLYKQHSARGYNRVEPYDVPAEFPTLMGVAANVYLKDYGYSLKQLSRNVALMTEDEFLEKILMETQKQTGNIVKLFA